MISSLECVDEGDHVRKGNVHKSTLQVTGTKSQMARFPKCGIRQSSASNQSNLLHSVDVRERQQLIAWSLQTNDTRSLEKYMSFRQVRGSQALRGTISQIPSLTSYKPTLASLVIVQVLARLVTTSSATGPRVFLRIFFPETTRCQDKTRQDTQYHSESVCVGPANSGPNVGIMTAVSGLT